MTVYTKKQELTATVFGVTGLILIIIGFGLGPLIYIFFFTGIAFLIPIINILLTQTEAEEYKDIKPLKRRK